MTAPQRVEDAHVQQTAPNDSLILAPVAITPTKPLTPSHVKGLLWLDLLFRATRLLRPTEYTNNRRVWDITLQTVGFWAFLDERYPDVDYGDKSEIWIGERYIEFHGARDRGSQRIDAYRKRIEESGWVHPSGVRILELWQEYYHLLGLFDPGLTRSSAIELSIHDALEELRARDCLLDGRSLGAGVFADLSAAGLPLRQLVDENGTDNYLFCILRDLLPLTHRAGQVLLLSDQELDQDYLILERMLERGRARVQRLTLGRVPINGQVQSSREGGWQEYTLDRIRDLYVPRVGVPAFQLGLRLYFIAVLGQTNRNPFSFRELERVMAHAARQVERLPAADTHEELRALLLRYTTKEGYVDPYRLASLLLAKRTKPEAALLLPLFVS